MTFKSILVLESEWELKKPNSYSVWPFISEFGKVYEIETYLKTFTDKVSFAYWLRMFDNSNVSRPSLVYIAAHGKADRLNGVPRDIEFEFIRRLLTDCESIASVYFACCLFGSAQNLSAIMESAKHLKWAAGFGESVNWIDSVAFDLLFLSAMAKRKYEKKGIHVQNIVQGLLDSSPKLGAELGFRFQFRQGKLVKGIGITTLEERQ